MKIIGLTGGIATGKTTVSHIFSDFGITVIDADIINYQLLLPNKIGYKNILKSFPDIPLLKDKSLDKTYLRNKIFNDKTSKITLENILHPLIKLEINLQIKKISNKNRSPYCIVSVPLMIEANFIDLVSSLWVCDCEEETQLKRLMKRDILTRANAKLILSHQLSRHERLKFADEIISTENQTIMIEKIKYLHQQQIKLNL